jgi:hypothetical protein
LAIGLFVLFFFWSLHCLFFDLRLLITLWYLQTFLLVATNHLRVEDFQSVSQLNNHCP